MTTAKLAPRPDHVPAELVVDFDVYLPLGPGDESGRRCVHQWLALSLVVPLLTG